MFQIQLYGPFGAGSAAPVAQCLPSDPGADRRTIPYTVVEARESCGTRVTFAPNVLAAQIMDNGVNVCPSGSVPGGRTGGTAPIGARLICVRCAPGFLPQEGAGCVAYTPPVYDGDPSTAPWRQFPLRSRMSQIPLPTSYYALGRYAPGAAVSFRPDGTYVVTSDHRAGSPQTDPIGLILHTEDQRAYNAHKDDEKLNLKTMTKLRVREGTLPFMTWRDPMTNAPVGAFFEDAPAGKTTKGWLTIRAWDPYTLSDLWNDIKGAMCSALANPAAPIAAVGAGAAVGLSPATVSGILAAAGAVCPMTPSQTPDSGGEMTTMYPEGTIHTLENGLYRIAVPIGSVAVDSRGQGYTRDAAGKIVATIKKPAKPSTVMKGASLGYVPQLLGPMPQLLGQPTHKEIANAEPSVDPATRGSKYVTPEQFDEMTGAEKPVYKKLWFWGAVAGGAAVLGGGIFIIRKRRGRRTR